MPYTKTILCLANSRKHTSSGRCVAGREIRQVGVGDWIRPVSPRATHEISEEERRFEDGTHPELLDLLTIQMTSHVPNQHQQENHEIDTGYYWLRTRKATWNETLAAVEQVNGPLWINAYSTYNGQNDQVPADQLPNLGRSLYLIRPENLRLVVSVDGAQVWESASQSARPTSPFPAIHYRIIVTDPIIENRRISRTSREHTMPDDTLVCASLGELHTDNYAYKLAAAIITPQRAGQ